MTKIYFHDNAPDFRGAPSKPFDPKKVNPTKFEDELRAKDCMFEVTLDPTDPTKSTGYGEWLAQESDYASDDFKREVKRAFKANGLVKGCKVSLRFGLRDDGFTTTFRWTLR